MSLFFILGAGASVDSGLPTYRGPGGIYQDVEVGDLLSKYSALEKIWGVLAPLYHQIKEKSPGPTYELIRLLGISHPGSFILTQNIDGYAHSTNLPVTELHGSWKTMTCVRCKKKYDSNPESITCECGYGCRPDIVLFDEKISQTAYQEILTKIKETRPQTTIVIGTSLQFLYLVNLITKAKKCGSRVIHINSDESYAPNVGRKDIWSKVSAAEGLSYCLESS